MLEPSADRVLKEASPTESLQFLVTVRVSDDARNWVRSQELGWPRVHAREQEAAKLQEPVVAFLCKLYPQMAPPKKISPETLSVSLPAVAWRQALAKAKSPLKAKNVAIGANVMVGLP